MSEQTPPSTITIRHAEQDDYLALHRILSGPKAAWGTLQLPFQSTALLQKQLSEPSEGRYWLVACVADEVVGSLTFSALSRPRRRHVGSLGMAVRDDWQQRGVGTALLRAALEFADSWLALHRVELTVYTDNAAAIALYQRFGFVIEGTHRDFAIRDGHFVDAYAMARIRDGELSISDLETTVHPG
jgi:L-phenylalanine/L-methionine N-acetyltransferase